RLSATGLTYRCACTRRDIAAAAAAPQETGGAPSRPGVCRCRRLGAPPGPAAIRLDLMAAAARAGPLTFEEIGAGPHGETGARPIGAEALFAEFGDIVLMRKDGAAAYHLAVVVDDAEQAVSHVTRGADLFSASGLHRILQSLLDLPAP